MNEVLSIQHRNGVVSPPKTKGDSAWSPKSLPRGNPVLEPTCDQLWSWAAKNPVFLERVLSTIPQERQLEVLAEVYKASLARYFDKLRAETAIAPPPGTGTDRGRSRSQTLRQSRQSRQSRSRSRSRSPVRKAGPPRPALPNVPAALAPFTEQIGLQSFLQLEARFKADLSTNGSGTWQSLSASEPPELVVILAAIYLTFMEKSGQSFYVIDGSPFLNFCRIDSESLAVHDILVVAQQRLVTALSIASTEATPKNIAQLAAAMHMSHLNVHILFRQELLADLLDPARLNCLYQQHRCKILTYYAGLLKKFSEKSQV